MSTKRSDKDDDESEYEVELDGESESESDDEYEDKVCIQFYKIHFHNNLLFYIFQFFVFFSLI